jgi:hypothetical protein
VSIDPESGATIPDGASAPFPDPGDTAQDYDAQAQAEVIAQYRESPKLRQTISDLMAGWQAIEDCIVEINKQLDPDIAEGVNLDVIGERVGQSRVLSDGTVPSDSFYRLLIAGRILRNRAIGSSPEFITALETFVFVGTPFRYYDLGHMTVGIEVPGEPNSNQKALINDGPMPRAMAVGVIKLWFNDANFFGFQGDPRPGLNGFGLASDLSLGGQLGMLF